VEDGLFIWLIVFAVAVLQGIGQRKKKSGQRPGQKPGMGKGPVPGTPRRRPVQSRGEPVSEPATSTTRASSSPREEAGPDPSSEGLIPADVWEEILGLARGKPPEPKPEPVPSPEEDLSSGWEELEEEPRETRPKPVSRELPPSHRAGAVLHQTAVSDVESRLGVPASAVPAAGASEEGRVRQDLFGSGSPEELRKAIILKEVLGPPLSLREE
jgi:hypothetical protein